MSLLKENGMRILADAACSAAENGEKNVQKQIVAPRATAKRTKRKFGFVNLTNFDEEQKDKPRAIEVVKRYKWGELFVSVSSDLPNCVQINFGQKIYVKLLRDDAKCFANILMRATQEVKDFAQTSAQERHQNIRIRYNCRMIDIFVDSNLNLLQIIFANNFGCKISVSTAQHLAEMVLEAAKAQKEFQ